MDDLESMLARLDELGPWDSSQAYRAENNSAYYLNRGFTPKDVDALCAVIEEDLEEDIGGSAPEPRCWAPVHAWRILALLQVPKAIPILVERLVHGLDDDWSGEELPAMIASFGAQAISELEQALEDRKVFEGDLPSYIGSIHTLERIADREPACRGKVSDIFRKRLSFFRENHPELNGWLVSALVELKDAEAMSVVRECFAEDLVDTSIIDAAYADQVWPELGAVKAIEDAEDVSTGGVPPYLGDEVFGALLRGLNSLYAVEDAKMLILGSVLGLEVTSPLDMLADLQSDADGEATEFSTEGDARRFFGQLGALWNQIAQVRQHGIPFPDARAHLVPEEMRDLSGVSLAAIVLRTELRLGVFLGALGEGGIHEANLSNLSSAGRLFQFLGRALVRLENCGRLASGEITRNREEILALLDELRDRWNAEIPTLADACMSIQSRHALASVAIDVSGSRPGRNDPCPCGSGKKYKRCCGL